MLTVRHRGAKRHAFSPSERGQRGEARAQICCVSVLFTTTRLAVEIIACRRFLMFPLEAQHSL